MPTEKALEALLQEDRVFSPSKAFVGRANIQDSAIYSKGAQDPLTFWEGFAKELHWFNPWSRVLEWKLPFAKWFVGGKTNIAYNALDRHLAGPRRNKAAILWEGEPG